MSIESDRAFLVTIERLAQESRDQFSAFTGIIDWMRSRQHHLEGLVTVMRARIEADEAAVARELESIDGELLDVVSAMEVGSVYRGR